jgi:hypothetical protein
VNLLSHDACDEACICIGYIALCGTVTVVHKLEKMLKEVVAILRYSSRNFLGKTE